MIIKPNSLMTPSSSDKKATRSPLGVNRYPEYPEISESRENKYHNHNPQYLVTNLVSYDIILAGLKVARD